MNLKQTRRKIRSFYLTGLSLLMALMAVSTFSCSRSPAADRLSQAVNQPTTATVDSLVNGDLMCYATLIDENGVRYESVGATFEICAAQTLYLNKRVNLVYGEVSVNDCQSAEPCGKTRLQTLITQMTPIDAPNASAPPRVDDPDASTPLIVDNPDSSVPSERVIQNAAIAPHIEVIAGDSIVPSSYRLVIDNPENIVFVYCPANHAPQMGYLRDVEAIRCEPF
ncbi:MAG: hypothetical protein HC769_04335 [Cyanobacteria bacterium CRU_2_1]|nr:hypothetical protein [Hydrococcus sp. RU_2_2]NJR58144.1 hypothetical protein [Cyanobacteria bacterium CRU_2_1]